MAECIELIRKKGKFEIHFVETALALARVPARVPGEKCSFEEKMLQEHSD